MEYLVYESELSFQKYKTVVPKKRIAKYVFENVPGAKSFPNGSALKNERDALKKYIDVL